jgi:hypothetical protein
MPIVPSDIKFIVSGGASNTDPNASLGGAISTAGGGVIVTDTLHAVWDAVSGAESSSGDTEYRGIFIKNTHGTISLTNAKVWISSNTTSTDDTIEIALAGEGINNTIETVANESTAPIGETFSAPSSFAGGLTLPTIAAGQAHGLWIKRIVSAAAAAANANPYTISVQGETTA